MINWSLNFRKTLKINKKRQALIELLHDQTRLLASQVKKELPGLERGLHLW